MNENGQISNVRINKAIAERGGFSRREADKLVAEGRVTIKKLVVTDLSTRVSESEEIFLDGKPLPRKSNVITAIVYHKPKGEIVSKRDPEGRRTIYASLPTGFASFIVAGRLDFASEGLLILTDNAELAARLTTGDEERIYNVKIRGAVTPAIERAMKEGLTVGKAGAHPLAKEGDLKLAPFAKWRVEKSGGFSRLKVALTEGKNREIRRFFAHFGAEVCDLKRVSFGKVSLNALPVGKWRYCSKDEYKYLRSLLKGAQEAE
ncbi:MAG: rRNA pseudouridine synthase [Helicobacteraceae bacterium]|jgi:23S rRNA pseudouridine2605 synthase|nr:rRNA pseudouridine synthase [Helicobacteraceae bacterium]